VSPILLHDVNGDPIIIGCFVLMKVLTDEERSEWPECATVINLVHSRGSIPDESDEVHVRETIHEIANLLDGRSLAPIIPKGPAP
jgi:hypothetical protein